MWKTTMLLWASNWWHWPISSAPISPESIPGCLFTAGFFFAANRLGRRLAALMT
jgi:hypothetical protein